MNKTGMGGQRKKAEKSARNAKPEHVANISPEQRMLTIPQSLELAIQCHNARDLPQAEGLYQQVLQADPNQTDALHLLGLIAHQVGKNDIAVEFITKALATQPDFAEAHCNLGNALKELGRLDEAVASYRKALAIQPDSAGAHSNLGLVLRALRRLDEAAASHRKALAIQPDSAEAHYNLGLALQDMGRLDEAITSYHKALNIKPDFVEAHHNLGLSLHDLRKLDEALPSYRKALAINPDFALAHYNLANALKDLGRLGEAVESFRNAISIKPDFVEAHNNLGNPLLELGKLDEAAETYRNALSIKPDFAESYYNLHGLILDSDDMAPAIKCIGSAVDIDPHKMQYRFILGMLLDYSGNPQEAATHFEMVEKGSDLDRAKLDAWRYIKSVNKKIPPIIGSRNQAFKLGLDAAVNDGLVLEFGVRYGASIRQIAAFVDQEVHGFDSFEGLPEAWHGESKGSYTTKGILPSVPENVILHKGWYEETLPGFVEKHQAPVRFINIDCDLYSSTKTVLELLSKQIISGTVLVFDEFIGTEKWREDEFKAFQEAVLAYGWKQEYLCFSFMTNQVVIRIN